MSDIFRSVLNNISSNFSIGSNADNQSNSNDGSHSDNQFVGQNIELKGIKLRVERVIAEGGFGFVFRVRDLQTSAVYALKRLIAADIEAKNEIKNEIEILSKLQTHDHIMKFISWGKINHNIYLLLSEFCGCGSLKDISLPVNSDQQINRIAYQTCLAIERMHSLGIIHRDLKIENILFDNLGIVKLCDFGSATTSTYYPDHNWTPIQRSLLEDEMSRHTTPMYRPPEILDTYLHLPINVLMDIWAFGCLLYVLKFGRHPFEDSAKLRIINCNYSIPSGPHESDIIVHIIRSCIRIDPSERMKARDIKELLEENFVGLKLACVNPRQPTPTQPTAPMINHNNQTPPQIPNSSQSSFSLSDFKRYIKDTSSKVLNSETLNVFGGIRSNTSTSNSQTSKSTSISDHSTKPIPGNAIPRISSNSARVELNSSSASFTASQLNTNPSLTNSDNSSNEIDIKLDTKNSDVCNLEENSSVSLGELINCEPTPTPTPAPAPAPTPIFNPFETSENLILSADRDGAIGSSIASDNMISDSNILIGDKHEIPEYSRAEPEKAASGPFESLNLIGFSDGSNVSLLDLDLFGPNIETQSSKPSNIFGNNIDPKSFDIFGPNIEPKSAKSPDLFANIIEPKSPDLLNESLSFIASTPLNSTAFPTVGLQRNTSTPNLTKLDPLDQLGSFLTSTSTTNKQNTSSIPRVSSYTTFQTANGPKPDYSRNYFIETQNSNNTRVAGNEFEDLLGEFKPKPNDCGTKSIGQLKKDEMLKDGTIDPMRLRVMEWKEGKTRNIRALLCSLNTIIWEGCNWQLIGMHQLVTSNDVKKMYRKACLAVHPDKLVGSEHEELAKLIFMELNDAWTEFEKQL